ncbi:MAG: ABATE domain-containing protein [Solirubrobacterales bacterium]
MAHKQQNAPGDLEAVRAFVNTVDLEDGAEELSDPPSLVRWLADHELIEPGTEATKADVRNAIAVREALRRQLLANNGAAVDAASVDTLRRRPGGPASASTSGRTARTSSRRPVASTAPSAGCSAASTPRSTKARGRG